MVDEQVTHMNLCYRFRKDTKEIVYSMPRFATQKTKKISLETGVTLFILQNKFIQDASKCELALEKRKASEYECIFTCQKNK